MPKTSAANDIEQFFTASEFKELSEYEKLRLKNIKDNYEMMAEIGLNVPKPEFMNGPFRKRKPKYVDSSDSDEEWKPGCADKVQRKKALPACRGKKFTVPVKTESTPQHSPSDVSQSSSAIAPKQKKDEDAFDYLGRVTINDTGDIVPLESPPVMNQEFDAPKKRSKNRAGSDMSQPNTHRYPQRQGAKKSYKDLDVPNDDCYVYCEDCHELYENDCSLHPLTIIEDNPVPKGCRDQAKRSLPDGLVIKEAGIKNAGLGVWAEKFFPKGVRFGPYGGEIVGEDVGEDSGYAWEIFDHDGKSHYVDGKKPNRANWMRYVNCACSEAQQNLVAYQYRGQIYYRSFKPISAGQELLVFYGEEYAGELGIVGANADDVQNLDNAERHPCSKCNMVFTDYKFLARHLQCTHQSSTEWYNYLKRQKLKVSSFNITACSVKVASQFKRKGFSRKKNTADLKQKLSPIIQGTSTGCDNHYPCQFCYVIFTDNALLIQHQRKKHGSQVICLQKQTFQSRNETKTNINLEQNCKCGTLQQPLVCSYCSKAFHSEDNLKTHKMMREKEEQPYSCGHCDKLFTKSSTFKNHVKSHQCIRPYACSHCDKTFTVSWNLKQHIRTHTGTRPYACSHCDKTFTQSGTLKKHIRTHHDTGTRPYACSHCDKTFTVSWNLKQHIRTHTGTRPYACSHCDKTFTQSGTLKKHIRTHTGTRPYACSHCDKTFTVSGSLKQHIRTHTGTRPYACSHCDKTFTESGNLKQHIRTHTGTRPYACSHCDKTFTQSGDLKKHIRTYTGTRPYACSHCDKTFTESGNLKQHIRTHTGTRPYACSHCDKTFTQSGNLKRHIRTHTGTQPYACSHCDKTFTQSGNLKQHIRTHTGTRPYACSHCDKTFTQSGDLKKHIRTHTGTQPYAHSHSQRAFTQKDNLKASMRAQACEP